MASIYTWVGVALAAVIIVTFVVPILMGRIEGFVVRSMAVIGGAVVALGLTTGILALAGLS